MTSAQWIEAPIGKQHDRASFDCGTAELNDYLKRFARQNHRLGGAKTFVAVLPNETKRVLGFYSLSPASLQYERTPDIVRKGLARHDVPMFRLGRLAVDVRWQRRGLGGQLLIAAAQRCMAAAEEVGGVGLLIDAKDDRAAAWYEGYGAVRLNDEPNCLVIGFATIRAAIERARSPGL